MAEVTVALLGAFDLRVADRPVASGQRRALLAALALSAGRTREPDEPAPANGSEEDQPVAAGETS